MKHKIFIKIAAVAAAVLTIFCGCQKGTNAVIYSVLGTEMPSQFTTAALYTLLNDRILENKPMVISTNLTIDELGRRYSPQIVSRLNGNFLLLPFVGEDIRVMKNRGL